MKVFVLLYFRSPTVQCVMERGHLNAQHASVTTKCTYTYTDK